MNTSRRLVLDCIETNFREKTCIFSINIFHDIHWYPDITSLPIGKIASSRIVSDFFPEPTLLESAEGGLPPAGSHLAGLASSKKQIRRDLCRCPPDVHRNPRITWNCAETSSSRIIYQEINMLALINYFRNLRHRSPRRRPPRRARLRPPNRRPRRRPPPLSGCRPCPPRSEPGLQNQQQLSNFAKFNLYQILEGSFSAVKKILEGGDVDGQRWANQSKRHLRWQKYRRNNKSDRERRDHAEYFLAEAFLRLGLRALDVQLDLNHVFDEVLLSSRGGGTFLSLADPRASEKCIFRS